MSDLLPIYVINLARRPDRLAAIADRLAAADLNFERIEAIDAQSTPDETIDRYFGSDAALGPVAKGDRCCTLSHLRFFDRLAKSPDEHALVLEDDAVFDGEALRPVLEKHWLPSGIELLKIEAYGPMGRKVIIGRQRQCSSGLSIARLHSRHTGAAGYIISRSLAAWLLAEINLWTMPIDHLLFNPQASPVFDKLKPYQLLPTLVRQFDFRTDSDLQEWRPVNNNSDLELVMRKLLRFARDVKSLPKQIAKLAFGDWHVVSL